MIRMLYSTPHLHITNSSGLIKTAIELKDVLNFKRAIWKWRYIFFPFFLYWLGFRQGIYLHSVDTETVHLEEK